MVFSFLRACAVLAAFAGPVGADTVAFQSRITGAYVGTVSGGLLSASAASPRALVLDMVRLEGSRVAFRDPESGLFLRAGVGQQTFLAVSSPHIRGWETFEMVQNGPDVTLRSVQNGLYVGTDGADPRLAARWGTTGQGQTFRMVPVGAPAAQPPAAQPPAAQPPAAQPPAAEAPQGRVPAARLSFSGQWQLEDLFADGRRLSLNDRALRQVQINIAARGMIEGHNGCNQIWARILEVGSVYRVDGFLTTKIGCSDVRLEIERAFNTALSGAIHFARAGTDTLEIRDQFGRVSARMRRQ